ncbi:hypothetical protein FSARC_6976 [Fusarium sarcochroum]|uniref:Uncharacterized protein n=1 Tax=Fusarium sarcochroum TaxID=1208366 RepID=A0A8H4TWI6_9HYPO|nr:hypothetical protein FSARC_6976 [Fusarium sarcochroum]
MKPSTFTGLIINAGLSLAAPSPTVTKATAIESVKADNGITTPYPIQPDMWNPTVGDECFNLWADVNVCVREIGFEYPTSAACSTGEGTLPWGKHKADALAAAREWCNSGGGANAYEIYETKETCIDAPSNAGKFTFSIRNEHERRLAITGNKCQALLKISIDGCPERGQGKTQSWFMETTFETGKCKA